MFLKSDTSKVVMSAIPIPGKGNPLSIDDMELVKRIMTELCGSGARSCRVRRSRASATPVAQRDEMAKLRRRAPDRRVEGVHARRRPAAGSLDDHEVGRPAGAGRRFIENGTCRRPEGHRRPQGLLGGGQPEYVDPVDVGPAAKANPDVEFVVYHSGYEPEDRKGPTPTRPPTSASTV